MAGSSVASAAILVMTYGGLVLGRLPGPRLDLAGIALLGAALTIGIGELTPGMASKAIDHDTIVFLLAMMIVVAHLRLSCFFRLVSASAVTHAHAPMVLLPVITLTRASSPPFLSTMPHASSWPRSPRM